MRKDDLRHLSFFYKNTDICRSYTDDLGERVSFLLLVMNDKNLYFLIFYKKIDGVTCPFLIGTEIHI